MRLSHTDESLPRIIRNILARHHYETTGPTTTYEDQGSKDRLLLELQLAAAMEKLCPFWGMAIPYDGRLGSGMSSFVKPRHKRYAATYNLDLAENMNAMYGDNEEMKRELIACMAMEMIAEIERIINGRDLLYYPCITARPMSVIDSNTFEPSFKFDTIFYLAKPYKDVWSLKDAPAVPITTPSEKFIAKFEQHLNDPIWPTSFVPYQRVSRA